MLQCPNHHQQGGPHSSQRSRLLQHQLAPVLVCKAHDVSRLDPGGQEPSEAEPPDPPNAVAAAAAAVQQAATVQAIAAGAVAVSADTVLAEPAVQ